MIQKLSDANLFSASETFSASWRFSHNGLVSGDELDSHTPERMQEVLKEEIAKGNEVFSFDEETESRGIISFSSARRHISKLYVSPAHIRSGIGRELVRFALSQMQKGEVRVHCLNVNFRAQAFYESLGFVYEGEKLPFEEREDLYLMVYVFRK